MLTQHKFFEKCCSIELTSLIFSLSVFAFPLMPSPHFSSYLSHPIHILSIILFSIFLFLSLRSFTSPLFICPHACVPCSSLSSSTFFSYFHTVRRMLWPLWTLTPSLWACRRHQEVGQEVVVTRKGQGRPNRNASTSPTSRSGSETQTSARCLGYKV